MLFLPKYGTICVCAAAAVVNPATSTATSKATTDEGRAASGTPVRMGKYLGKGDSWSETAAILLLRPGACKRRARRLVCLASSMSSGDGAARPFSATRL